VKQTEVRKSPGRADPKKISALTLPVSEKLEKPSVVLPASVPHKALLPWLVAIALFMEALDTTILNTAVPTISTALGVVPLDMKAVLASYTLSLAVFIPISGWMADRFGTRRVFTFAIALFTLASLLCGLSNDLHVLIACRILQGCGGAMMVPVGRLTLVRTFPKSELIRAMSFVAMPALIGPMLGPLAGGLIVDYLHWRVIFLVNIPIGLLGLWMVHRYLPDYREKHTHPLDMVGMILFSAGVALFSYVLEVFGDHTLSTFETIGLLALSVMLIASYGLHAKRVKFPLLRLSVFRIRTFSIAVLGSFFTRIGMAGTSFLLPLLYQIGFGYTPVQSGLLIMPQAMASISTKFIIPHVLRRLGHRGTLISNTMIVGVGLMMFATIGPETPMWHIAVQVFIYGAFTSMQYTSMNTLVYADVAPDQTSNASSIASTFQQMALSFGVASAGLVTAFFIPDYLHAPPDKLVSGIHDAFLTMGVFTILSTLMFWRLKRDDGANVTQQKVASTGDAAAGNSS
jgi:EmrB/QacA subfamily drug resistance transporter